MKKESFRQRDHDLGSIVQLGPEDSVELSGHQQPFHNASDDPAVREVTPRGHQLLAKEKAHRSVNPFPWTTQEGEGALSSD